MTNINRALFVINETYKDEYVKQHMTPLEVTKALAKEGLLAPEPQIIRTVDDLHTLDPDTVLGVWHPDLHMGCIFMPAREWADEPSVPPLAVIATGDHVRAARQALEATE